MGGKLKFLLAFAILGIASGDVKFETKFVKNRGWNINCSWKPDGGEIPFTKIIIARNNETLFTYEPKDNSTISNKGSGKECVFDYTCGIKEKGEGGCSIMVNITSNASDEYYNATAFWGTISLNASTTVFVKASNSAIEKVQKSAEVETISCTSNGIPKPILLWTSSKATNFTLMTNQTAVWNNMSKLWEARSEYRKSDKNTLTVTCTPEQTLHDGKVIVGVSATHTFSNSAGRFGAPDTFLIVLMALTRIATANLL